ncbi:hypothetical protein IGI80_003017 [Enterococcus sp. DIV1420a]
MLEKCLEKCVCCGSDKMVKNGRLLQGLSVECESCGLMLSVPCQISEEQNDISSYYSAYYTIPKYEEEIHFLLRTSQQLLFLGNRI